MLVKKNLVKRTSTKTSLCSSGAARNYKRPNGVPCTKSKTPKKPDDARRILTVEGSYASAGFCRRLLGEHHVPVTTITNADAEFARAFFRPVIDKDGPEKHPAAVALSTPGNRVSLVVARHPLADHSSKSSRLQKSPMGTRRLWQKPTEALYTLFEYGIERTAHPIRDVDDKENIVSWEVDAQAKAGTVVYFKTHGNRLMVPHADLAFGYDKIPLITKNMGANIEAELARRGIRMVPGSIIRGGAYIGTRVSTCQASSMSARMWTVEPWWTLGQPLVPARRSVKTVTCPVALASVAFLNLRKPCRPSSKITASLVHAQSSSKAYASELRLSLAQVSYSRHPCKSSMSQVKRRKSRRALSRHAVSSSLECVPKHSQLASTSFHAPSSLDNDKRARI